MYISVIIITHNSGSIYKCIEALKKQIENNDEVIVVDDHSSEHYFNKLYRYCSLNDITILKAKKRGNRGHNRNLGAQIAKNVILLFLDPDMILYNTSISAIKKAYLSNNHLAYIGTRSAGRYDPITMKIFDGINIQDVMDSVENYDFLFNLPSVKDKRYNIIKNNNAFVQKYNWIYYFTCCCTILKKDFCSLNGFDESFVGWGVEDIDLGYRISQIGSISFLYGFGGVHIPHNRELIYAEQDNCRNLKRMLHKFQTLDLELLCTYRISAEQLEKTISLLGRMRMADFPPLIPDERKNIIYLNCISSTKPYGEMIYVNETGERKILHLIGISTFFEEGSIDTILISSNIVLYPKSIICGILQECLRIGKNVIIDGKLPNYRLDWNDFQDITLFMPQKRNEYRIHDVIEFEFSPSKSKNQIQVTSNFLSLEDKKIVPSKLSLSSIKNKSLIGHSYCVINLTHGSGYNILLKQMKDTLQLNYLGVYNVLYASNTNNKFEFPEHLLPLLSLKTSIFLIVDNIYNFNFEPWKNRNNIYDIVVDFHGNIVIN